MRGDPKSVILAFPRGGESSQPQAPWTDASERDIAERLERGEVVHYPVCPFALHPEDDYRYLLEQRLAGRAHKNIGFDPHTGTVSGHRADGPGQGQRLGSVFAAFSREVTRWLGSILPHYARSCQLDRVSFRPEEEATRKLRTSARNDLLHIDAFPSRPTNGQRILRIFVNINPTEDRVWVTSEPFGKLLARYGKEVGLPVRGGQGWGWQARESMLSLFRPGQARRSSYDAFMLRFHNWLKASEQFQQTTPKRLWEFHPGSAWLAITDTASHSVLRGRFALEHSYFLSPDSLALPEEAPAALLQKACGVEVLNRAA